jgi:hypothetical protein
MFPRALFFDTPFHMHDAGAERMTATVAEKLRGILAERSPAARLPDAMQLPVAPPLVIDMSEPGVPAGVGSLDGFGATESWGRWTDGPHARVVLASPLPRRFRLTVEVRHAFGANATDPTTVRIGDQARSIPFVPGGAPATMEFSLRRPDQTIVIVPSHPDSPKALGLGEDSRRLGVGLSLLTIEAIMPSDGGESQPSGARN